MRIVEGDQLVERHSVQIFHRIVEQTLRRPTVIEDGDRVRMIELARQADFALESGDRLRGRLIGIEQLDCRQPLQHRMMAAVHNPRAARANFFIQRVLPELQRIDGSPPGVAFQPRDEDRKHKDHSGCGSQ